MTCKAPPAPRRTRSRRPFPGSPKYTRSPHIFDVHQAIINKDLPEITRLTQGDLDLGQPIRGTTALSLAVYRGEVEAVKCLLERGAPVDRRSKDHLERLETPLISAIRLGHWNILKLLIGHHASLTLRDFYNQSPIWFAVKEQRFVFVQYLLASGAPITYCTAAENPLNLAMQFLGYKGRRQMALELIAAGLPLTHEDYKGHSPLYWAYEHHDLTVFDLLLQAGVRLKAYDWLWGANGHADEDNGYADTNMERNGLADTNRRNNGHADAVNGLADTNRRSNGPADTTRGNNGQNNRFKYPKTEITDWRYEEAASHWLRQEITTPPSLLRQSRVFIRQYLIFLHGTDVRPLLRALTLSPALPLPPPILTYLSLTSALTQASQNPPYVVVIGRPPHMVL